MSTVTISAPATSARQIYQRCGWQQAERAYPAAIPPMGILIIPLARPLSRSRLTRPKELVSCRHAGRCR